MIRVLRRVSKQMRLRRTASVAVLLLYAFLTAFAAPEILLQGNDDDIGLGTAPREPWEHALLVTYSSVTISPNLMGISNPGQGIACARSASVLDGDIAMQFPFMLAMALLTLPCAGVPARIVHPLSLDLSPRQLVPRLPPRLAA